MIAPRFLAAAFLLLVGGLLACASTGPPRYWTEFAPTYPNFERHFDRHAQQLDPIEGIWAILPTQTAVPDTFVIVRDTSYTGYDFVGILVSGRQRLLPFTVRRMDPNDPRARAPVSRRPPVSQERGEIFIALRRSATDERAYEYSDVAVLRGESCADEPCQGVYFIAADGELHRQRFAGEDHSSGRGWVKRYPPW